MKKIIALFSMMTTFLLMNIVLAFSLETGPYGTPGMYGYHGPYVVQVNQSAHVKETGPYGTPGTYGYHGPYVAEQVNQSAHVKETGPYGTPGTYGYHGPYATEQVVHH